jgi:hypothetical protein
LTYSIENTGLNRQFDGFCDTPFLWKESLEGLKMFKPAKLSIHQYPEIDLKSHIRLGKLIEQFVLFELDRDESICMLKSNIQIFSDKITIGELDCLLHQAALPIHLEIVYKFYLYDPSMPAELDRWIGPNRKDSLVYKLNKLKNKQLPLLYHPETTRQLQEFQINVSEFEQQVFFKAQLFIPFNSLHASLPPVNKDCIKGFYVRHRDLKLFKKNTFYVPDKLDWLVAPHQEVKWISFQAFEDEVSRLTAAHKSPLCWMRSTDGKTQKFFVVWW